MFRTRMVAKSALPIRVHLDFEVDRERDRSSGVQRLIRRFVASLEGNCFCGKIISPRRLFKSVTVYGRTLLYSQFGRAYSRQGAIFIARARCLKFKQSRARLIKSCARL